TRGPPARGFCVSGPRRSVLDSQLADPIGGHVTLGANKARCQQMQKPCVAVLDKYLLAALEAPAAPIGECRVDKLADSAFIPLVDNAHHPLVVRALPTADDAIEAGGDAVGLGRRVHLRAS